MFFFAARDLPMEKSCMNILFLNAYFYPENIAFTHLENDLIEGFIAAGHEITVVCPVPTRGISKETAQQYRSIKKEDLYNGKVHVIRFWAPQEGRNPIIRAFRYFWCNLREYQIGVKQKHADVIFAGSTPPTQGYMSGCIGKRLKCPVVYAVHDVFPDSLVTTGLTAEGSLIWKIGRILEKMTYKKCQKLIVISDSIARNLLRKGVPEERLAIIPNWVDAQAIQPVPRDQNRLIGELALNPDQFLVVYAGNFGAAQGAHVVLEAAKLLQQEKNIQFVIFAGGPEAEQARKTVEDENLENVCMNPLLPQERVPEVYSLGNVALITCKKGIGSSGMPSKTWSIMACNTPIIASFDTDSELAEIIQKANAGICVEPESAAALAQAILDNSLKNSNARKYVEKYASKEACVEKYLNALETAANNYR